MTTNTQPESIEDKLDTIIATLSPGMCMDMRHEGWDKQAEQAIAAIVELVSTHNRREIVKAKIEALRSIDCIVYDPVDLERYLDERIKTLEGAE